MESNYRDGPMGHKNSLKINTFTYKYSTETYIMDLWFNITASVNDCGTQAGVV